MPSARQWWRRAAAAAKDKCSLSLALAGRGHSNPEMEAAVIRATTHDPRRIDYKNSSRVFRWARASPSSALPLLLRSLSRRASRTRSWPVALKSLLLLHGLLLLHPTSSPSPPAGRLPFDLSDFRDPSSPAPFSAFVRAYFQFLDHRSILLQPSSPQPGNLGLIQNLQLLLDLLLQVRPYGDGMEVGLILEAMDCVVIEIFEVYSGICSGIASFLVGVLGRKEGGDEEARRRSGLVGIRVLRKAAEQSSQLSAFFELCRSLGVLNAAEFPPVEGIPEEDIRDLERIVMMGGVEAVEEEEEGSSGTVVTEDWVVFDDEMAAAAAAKEGQLAGNVWNPFLGAGPAGDRMWAAMVRPPAGGAGEAAMLGNLIEI